MKTEKKQRYVRIACTIQLDGAGVTEESDEALIAKFDQWKQMLEAGNPTMKATVKTTVEERPMPDAVKKMLDHVKKEGYGR